MVAELMTRLGDADFRNGNGLAFAPHAEGSHTRHIRLKGEHHKVIDRAEIVACHGFGDIAVGTIAVSVGDGGQWRIEPRVRAPRADLRLSDGGKVLIEASFVLRSHFLLKTAHFR